MKRIIKKCNNGNIYYYYKNKIKRIDKNGKINWYTKQIFKKRHLNNEK
ncbi:hypothetical protein [Candidatus Phytoplasma pyri]